MIQTATVTLKKGSETLKRDLYDENGIKVGGTYVIDSEPWTVEKVGPESKVEAKPEPKPEPKAEKPKTIAAKAKVHVKHRR